MHQIITYCFWGEDFSDIVFEINKAPEITAPIEKKIKRNQVIVYIDVHPNEDYLAVFGNRVSNETLELNRQVNDLKILHPKANTFKTIYENADVYLSKIRIKRYIDTAYFELDGQEHQEHYLTTHIFIDTNGPAKNLPINPLYHSFRYYNELGFLIVQKDDLQQYVYRNGLSKDLLSVIESTDVAEELAQSGIMSILWGFRPWYYKIIITEKLNHQLPVGIKVAETGFFKFSRTDTSYDIVPGGLLENIELMDAYHRDAFNVGKYTGYSTKFYVAGGRSGLQTFEGLSVYVHIELLSESGEIVEYDQVDPLEEFTSLFQKDKLGDGTSFNV